MANGSEGEDRRGGAVKRKTSQLAVNQNNTVTDSEGDDDNDDNGSDGNGAVNQMDVDNELIRGADSTRATAVNSGICTEVQQNTRIIAAQLIPPPVGMTEDKYNFQVMDTYINEKHRVFVGEKSVMNTLAMIKVRGACYPLIFVISEGFSS